MMVATKPGDREAAEGYGALLDRIKAAMGPEFAARHDSSLQAKVEASIRAAANRRPLILE